MPCHECHEHQPRVLSKNNTIQHHKLRLLRKLAVVCCMDEGLVYSGLPHKNTCRSKHYRPSPLCPSTLSRPTQHGCRCHTTPEDPRSATLHATSCCITPQLPRATLCSSNSLAGPLNCCCSTTCLVIVVNPQLLGNIVLLVHVQAILDCLDGLCSTQNVIHAHHLVLILLVVLEETPDLIQPVWGQL